MHPYTERLYEVADSLSCGLRLEPNLAGMMYVEFGYVEGPDPGTSTHFTPQQALAVGLHELGHYYHDHTQGRPPMSESRWYFTNGVLRSEAEAWDFALDEMRMLPDEIEFETRTFMWYQCLGSYYTAALTSGGRDDCTLPNGNRHHVKFAYDKPDDFFWNIKAQILGQEEVAVVA